MKNLNYFLYNRKKCPKLIFFAVDNDRKCLEFFVCFCIHLKTIHFHDFLVGHFLFKFSTFFMTKCPILGLFSWQNVQFWGYFLVNYCILAKDGLLVLQNCFFLPLLTWLVSDFISIHSPNPSNHLRTLSFSWSTH